MKTKDSLADIQLLSSSNSPLGYPNDGRSTPIRKVVNGTVRDSNWNYFDKADFTRIAWLVIIAKASRSQFDRLSHARLKRDLPA
jgi:hypothetical protein